MNTIDEQLDAANAQAAELKAQVATLTDALQAAEQDKAILETANAELTDNLADAKERLAKQEAATHEALAQVEQLKANGMGASDLDKLIGGSLPHVTQLPNMLNLPPAEIEAILFETQ